MAQQPGSKALSQHKAPHSYKKHPDEDREADRLLEQLAEKLARDKGITKDEARRELRHWV